MKKVGLLIVNYNDFKNTINLIKNVDNYKIINKIVIVDNKSTDENYLVLSKFESDKVHIISCENKGYNNAINVGSKYLIDEIGECYIFVSNTDIEIPNEDVFTKLISDFTENVGCVMPKILENNNYNMGWKLTSVNKDLLMNIPLINRLYRSKIKLYDKSYFAKSNVVDVVHGSFFVIRSDVLEDINYMDDKVFLYYEESILARKLQIVNKLSLINNNVYVIHKHNQSIGNNVSKLNKYKIYKKSQLYYEKNYNNANVIQMALFRLFYYVGLILLEISLLFRG